jgi:hypothetical protein
MNSALSFFTGGLLFGWPAGAITALFVTRKYWDHTDKEGND